MAYMTFDEYRALKEKAAGGDIALAPWYTGDNDLYKEWQAKFEPLGGGAPGSATQDDVDKAVQDAISGDSFLGGITPPEHITPLEEGFQLPDHLRTISTYDPTALRTMQERALQEGRSPWAETMLAKQGLEETAARDAAQQQQAGSLAGARSNLAMRGGLRGGAAERLEQSGARNLMGAQQNIGRAGQMARADIDVRDEAAKAAMLQQLPGAQAQYAQTQASIQGQNVGNILDQVSLQNAANQAAYAQQMQAWAAKEQGIATRAAGGGGKK